MNCPPNSSIAYLVMALVLLSSLKAEAGVLKNFRIATNIVGEKVLREEAKCPTTSQAIRSAADPKTCEPLAIPPALLALNLVPDRVDELVWVEEAMRARIRMMEKNLFDLFQLTDAKDSNPRLQDLRTGAEQLAQIEKAIFDISQERHDFAFFDANCRFGTSPECVRAQSVYGAKLDQSKEALEAARAELLLELPLLSHWSIQNWAKPQRAGLRKASDPALRGVFATAFKETAAEVRARLDAFDGFLKSADRLASALADPRTDRKAAKENSESFQELIGGTLRDPDLIRELLLVDDSAVLKGNPRYDAARCRLRSRMLVDEKVGIVRGLSFDVLITAGTLGSVGLLKTMGRFSLLAMSIRATPAVAVNSWLLLANLDRLKDTSDRCDSLKVAALAVATGKTVPREEQNPAEAYLACRQSFRRDLVLSALLTAGAATADLQAVEESKRLTALGRSSRKQLPKTKEQARSSAKFLEESWKREGAGEVRRNQPVEFFVRRTANDLEQVSGTFLGRYELPGPDGSVMKVVMIGDRGGSGRIVINEASIVANTSKPVLKTLSSSRRFEIRTTDGRTILGRSGSIEEVNVDGKLRRLFAYKDLEGNRQVVDADLLIESTLSVPPKGELTVPVLKGGPFDGVTVKMLDESDVVVRGTLEKLGVRYTPIKLSPEDIGLTPLGEELAASVAPAHLRAEAASRTGFYLVSPKDLPAGGVAGAKQLALTHPELPKYVEKLNQGGVSLLIDSSLPQNQSAAAYFLYSGRHRFVAISPTCSWEIFRHEFQHFVFDSRVRSLLSDEEHGFRLLGKALTPDRLRALREAAPEHAAEVEKALKLSTRGRGVRAADEWLATEVQRDLLKAEGYSRLDASYLHSRQYGLRFRIGELEEAALQRTISPLEKIGLRRARVESALLDALIDSNKLGPNTRLLGASNILATGAAAPVAVTYYSEKAGTYLVRQANGSWLAVSPDTLLKQLSPEDFAALEQRAE